MATPCRQTEVVRFPELPRRPKLTRQTHVAALARRRGRVLVVRLPENSPRWAGMWCFPMVEMKPNEPEAAAAERALIEASGLEGRDGGPAADLVHHVTRYRIHLKLRDVTSGQGCAKGPFLRWCYPSEMENLAMPAAHRKLAQGLSGGI